MTEINTKPNLIAFIGTLLIWTLIFLFFSFVLVYKPKTYKTIQIRLDSVPHSVEKPKTQEQKKSSENQSSAKQTAQETSNAENVQNVEQAKADVQQSVKQSELPAVQKTEAAKVAEPVKKPAEPPVQKKAEQNNAKKTQPQKNEPVLTPQPQQEVVPVKSVEELMQELNSKPREKKVFNWDEAFGDDDDVPSSAQKTTDSVQSMPVPQTSLAGNAAESSSGTENSAVSAVSKSNRNVNTTATSETKGHLGKIASTKFSGDSNGTSTDVEIDASSGNGELAIKMSDGKLRKLIDPKEPKIELSEEAAKLIDTKIEVKITFTVNRDGTVALVTISDSTLPPLVGTEVREEILKWRFERADTNGQAEFKYTIMKR